MSRRAEPEIGRLAAKLPAGAVSTAEADRLAVSMDLWPRHILRLWSGKITALPEAVVWPQSVRDLQVIVDYATTTATPLVPYGAGSSVVGGATAEPGQLVVDLKRMTRVLGIDAEAYTATVETGIMGELFERQLERRGFTQGHFPSSIYCSSVGGWIAARGAGQMSSRYGKIEDQVLGGTVVVGDGSVVRIAPSPVRPPLLDALIGSEGALGLWAEAIVRIQPLPEARVWRGILFPTLDAALAAAQGFLLAGLSPSVVRIYDPVDSLLHRNISADKPPHDRGPSRLAAWGSRFPRLFGALADRVSGGCRAVVGVQGEEAWVRREMADIVEIARAHGGKDLGKAPGEAWWRRRYAVSYKQSNAFRAGAAVDTMEVACTWDKVRPVYEAVRDAGRRCGAQVLAHFSHIYLEGASIYFTYALPAEMGERGYDALWEGCLSAALAAGGNVSHHHGIGRLKAAAFQRVLGGALSLMKAQARELDPTSILNPGVLALKGNEVAPARASSSARASSAGGSDRSGAGAASRDGVAPVGDGLVVTAGPTTRLGEIEAVLRAKGRTLGPVGHLLGDEPLLDAARRGLLWRKGTQLHLLEPIIMGLDGAADGVPYRFIPAPRAAMGSELWPALLKSDVARIWLRCLPVAGAAQHWVGTLDECLVRAQKLARDEDLGGASITLAGDGKETVLSVAFEATTLGAARQAALRTRFGTPLSAADCEARGLGDNRKPLGAGFVPLSAMWASTARVLEAIRETGVQFIMPFIDAVGVAGFAAAAPGRSSEEKTGPALTAEQRRRLEEGISACGAFTGLNANVSRSAALAELRARPAEGIETTSADGTSAAARTTALAAAAPGRAGALPVVRMSVTMVDEGPRGLLHLPGHRHELDNCTYCPKLCRFACPVAVADGSETLTPRQLMLTANLEAAHALAQSADITDRLYSCVDCRGCKSFCDHGNDVATALMEARAELFLQGRAPARVRAALTTLRKTGRLPDRPASDAPSVEAEDGGATTFVFLGCQNTSADHGPAQALITLARRHFGRVRRVSGGRACCGQPLWRWGDREGFAEHARLFAAQLAGAERVIVDDPGCAYTLRVLYPQVGVHVPEVLTATSLIGRAGVSLLGARAFLREVVGDDAVADPAAVGRAIVPHDDEWATRYLGELVLRDLVRESLATGSVTEGQAGSAGGSLLALYDAALATKVAKACAADLLGGGGRVILTASPTVRRNLRAAGAAVLDIVELWSHASP